MSGMTRSMPSISSSGNMRPASTTTMSSPCSMASMFLPISPTPPSGITRSGALLTKERHLVRGLLLHLLRSRRLGREHQREGREITLQRAAQRGLVECRRGVIHGEHGEAARLARLAVDARDRFAREELPHRVTSERHDDARLQHLEVALQPDVARGDLLRQRVAVLRRPVADDVGDEHLAAVQTDAGEELVEQLPRGAHERPSLLVLVIAGRLTEEEDPRFGTAFARNGLTSAAMERARGARAYLCGERPEIIDHSDTIMARATARSGFHRCLPRQIENIRIRPPRHLDHVHDESRALEHRERLLPRGEVEALAAPARESEAHRDQLLPVGERVAGVEAPLLRLHDERPALAQG